MSKKRKDTDPLGYEDALEHLSKLFWWSLRDGWNLGCIGGIIHAERLKEWVKNSEFKGIRMWFCKKPEEKPVFLVMDPVFEDFYTSHDIPTNVQVGQDFSIAKSLIMGEDLEEINLFNWFRGEDGNLDAESNLVSPPQETFTNTDVESWKQEFLRVFKDFPLNKQGWTYFIDETDKGKLITQLANRNGFTYLGYCFGYDHSCEDNCLRVMLIPVNAMGRNIVSEAEESMLQYSWPPKT
ncbi:hypothetical protein SAMN04489724_0642 [Algoriphagus locisalis]|uniref:Uncharacterized protein n=1 Tax=Algoriphagus locisalis TaxID=305507 RepID=A0A1I6XTK3_9BACT|nr:hypothetical protein [Algoriphagus locisalis]SFT41211.1 hypothetical protein SAMN04489724_0642 [Algoriphagus locisalis]